MKSNKIKAKLPKSDKSARASTLCSEGNPTAQDITMLVALFTEGRYSEAEKLALMMTERFPGHGFGWTVLGAIFKQTGRSADALMSMKNVVTLVPNDADAYCNLGVAYQDMGRLAEAEACYRRVLQLKPGYAKAHSHLGDVLRSMGRLDVAEASYRQALVIMPDFAEAHNNLGLILQERGRPEEAEVSLRRALEIKPDFIEAHYNLGNTLYSLNRINEAETSYRKTLESRPDYAEAHYNLGNTLRELDRLDEAETSYRHALRVKPDYAEAHYNLGYILHEQGCLDEAEAVYRRTLEIKPDYAEVYNNLSNTLSEMGRLEEAEASYRRALEIRPDYAEAYNNLGNALWDMRRLEEAEASYRRVLEIKSDHVPGVASSSVTALLPFGRSGSLFLHSLFDGHPEIATLPGVYFKGWFGMDQWKNFAPDIANPDWRERLAAAILEEYQPLFDARSKKNVAGKPMDSAWLARDLGFTDMGVDRSQYFTVDQNAFKSAFLTLLAPLSSVGQKDCFELIHRAFEIAIRGNTAAGSCEGGQIFYHIHNPNPFEMAHFLQHYPQARLLYIMRNPVQSMESWMLIAAAKGIEVLPSLKRAYVGSSTDTDYKINHWNKMVGRVIAMFTQMQPLSFNALPNSRGVRLEDVKRHAERVMPQLAAWMGIADHPALYEASFCGLQYWGPASRVTGKITGFDTKAIDQPVGRLLGPRDIVIFETLFWPLSRLYGYTDLDEAGFRMKLAEIRPWLDEPLEFEMRFYANISGYTCALKELSPYKRLHRLLHEYWAVLDRDGTYHGMVQPIELK